MKKLFALFLAIVLTLCACGTKTGESSSAAQGAASGSKFPWADDEILLTFEGAAAEQMTVKEFMELEQMTVELTRTNSKGKTTTGIYTGVHWKTLAEAIGAQDAQSIKVVASDGFEQAYPMEVLMAPGSLFAVYKDGEPITEEKENGQVWFCADEEFTANYWSKFIVKIVIE
jgi:hypothetical protein